MAETSPALGHVFQLNRKSSVPGERGLPKVAVQETRFLFAGVEGDFNVYRHEVSHDDPAMAVLIVPRETLDEFDREGWPVRPGDLGENVTSTGIPYADFLPGRRFSIGEAIVEVSKPCTPCENLFLLPYVGSGRGPEFLRATVGRRGWYAKVVCEGRVRTGDPISASP